MKKLYLPIMVVAMFSTATFSQELTQADSKNAQIQKQDIYRPHSVVSSLWVLSNFFPDPDHFYQLGYGYQFTQKDNMIVEAITWTYDEPLGTYGSADEFYPGKIRAYGMGLGYQRFHWKKLFTTV